MSMTAADIMTRDVVIVAPETPVREVAALLASHKIGAVPVVNAEGVVVGVATEEDMVKRAADIHLPRFVTLSFLGSIIYLEDPDRFREEAEKILATTAQEIMDTEIHTIAPSIEVDDVAAYLLDKELRRLLVLDDAGRLRGIITRADIVRVVTGRTDQPE